MKRSLVGIMAGLAVTTAMDSNAAANNGTFVDKDAGTISREIQTGAFGAPHRETLSCKYAYITVTRGDAVHTIDLLQGLTIHATIQKRAETARAECNKNGLRLDF